MMTMTPRQYVYLSLLVLYTSGLSFLMHRSRRADPSLPQGGLYSVPTSIFLAEIVKLVVSVSVACVSTNRKRATVGSYDRLESQREAVVEGEKERAEAGDEEEDQQSVHLQPLPPGQSTLQSVTSEVFSSDCWKLGVPAALYVAQNLLQMVAITTVSAVTYQAVTQLKVLATTALSTWLLSRRYSGYQWISICVLVTGVIMVSSSKIQSGRGSGTPTREETAMMALKVGGMLSTLIACTLGSGAAVYMEKVLKSDRQTSLWIRNAQLSLFSLVPAAFAVLYDAHLFGSWQPMRWFTSWAWFTVFARSLGGFLIALVLKQTDALLKGIATSIAMVFSILIDSVLFDVPISFAFALGGALVISSSFAYVQYGSSK